MTPDSIRAIVIEELGRIAPEADASSLAPDDDLRQADVPVAGRGEQYETLDAGRALDHGGRDRAAQ